MTLDRYYRTPHLGYLHQDGKVNLKVIDGRPLLREWLPEGSTEDELRQAAQKEIMFLVLRDIVDILPLLQVSLNERFVYMSMRPMDLIRKVAFYRGRIPYLPRPKAKKIFGAHWDKAMSEASRSSNPVEQFQGVTSKMKVFSCDYLALLAYDDDSRKLIYNSGQTAGFGFQNDKWIFEKADELGVVISTIPSHPLEIDAIKGMDINPKKEEKAKEVVPNTLPEPPEGILTGRRTGFQMDPEAFPEIRRSKPAFKMTMARLDNKGDDLGYVIDSEPANRFDFMRYIPWAMTQGMTLREICKGTNGTPTMMEVAKWSEWYPDFARAMAQAEQIQAHVFADQAQEIVMSVSVKEDVPVAKLQAKFLMDRAALQAEKFRPRQVIQTENLNESNTLEIKNKLRMLILSNQNIPTIKDVIDVTPDKQEVISLPTISTYESEQPPLDEEYEDDES